MQATFVTTGDVPAPAPGPTVYWVSVWAAPPAEGNAWAVDEWRITDARDFLEVFDWATAQTETGASFEIFAESWEERARPEGTTAVVAHHLRLFGAPRDTPAASVTVEFTRSD